MQKKSYRCDLDGKNAEQIDFSEALDGYPDVYYNIVSNSSIDHVFFVTEEYGFIFAIKYGSAEYKTIEIEEK